MEYIQDLFYLTQDYWILTIIVGLFSTFFESFIPALPLVAIVTFNAAVLGMVLGFIVSWIGSSMGTACLFLLISKFNDSKLFTRIRTERINKAISWIDSQGFKLLFIAYSCPFMPGCLVTIASAFCRKKFSDFVAAMIAGKFVMFLVVSYIGSDIIGFLKNPIKMTVFGIVVFISWKMGNRLNKTLEAHETHEKHQIKDTEILKECVVDEEEEK